MKYCSLGEMCHSAMLLKNNGLKDASYPFDWIFSNINMVKHCIEDNFKTYLDKSYYGPSDIRGGVCEHSLYGEWVKVEGKIVFNHHDPLANEEHYAYYQRCVKRFKDLLASSEEKTFLLFYRNKSEDYKNYLAEATSLCNFLSKYTTNFNFLCIYHNPTGKQGHKILKSKNLKFVHLRTNSVTTGTEFIDESDNVYLNNILNEIR